MTNDPLDGPVLPVDMMRVPPRRFQRSSVEFAFMRPVIENVALSDQVIKGELGEGPLSQADYLAMKMATSSWRDTLLLMFLRNTGFRPVEVARAQARHLVTEGPHFAIMVHRAKKQHAKRQNVPEYEPVWLNPLLGQPLIAWVKANRPKPQDPIFPIETRQMRNVVYAASLKALARRVEPKRFRRLYIRSVAETAADVLGFSPQHMQVASMMVGHESAVTTWDWYFELTQAERIAIQEMIPV